MADDFSDLDSNYSLMNKDFQIDFCDRYIEYSMTKTDTSYKVIIDEMFLRISLDDWMSIKEIIYNFLHTRYHQSTSKFEIKCKSCVRIVTSRTTFIQIIQLKNRSKLHDNMINFTYNDVFQLKNIDHQCVIVKMLEQGVTSFIMRKNSETYIKMLSPVNYLTEELYKLVSHFVHSDTQIDVCNV